MRKYLVGATAAVAGIALAVPAVAADDMMGGVKISGGINQDIGFGNWQGGGEAEESIHFQTDATLTFQASGETDGGLGVAVTIQLDGDGGGDVKDNHLTISGAFGSIILGGEDNAAKAHGGAGIPGGYAGMGAYDGGDDYTPFSGGAGPFGGSQAQGIRISLPNMGGFQAGLSFQPDGSTNGGDGDTSGTDNDNNIIAVGANFSTDFAGTSLTIGGGWITEDEEADGAGSERYGIGSAIGIGDTTLSLRFDNHSDAKTSYAVGVDHSMGALTFGIAVGSAVTRKTHMWAPRALPSDMTATSVQVGGSYDMGGGVTLSAGISQGSVENVDAAGTDNDDVGVGLRIAFSF